MIPYPFEKDRPTEYRREARMICYPSELRSQILKTDIRVFYAELFLAGVLPSEPGITYGMG